MERKKRFERIRVGFTLNLEPDVEKQKIAPEGYGLGSSVVLATINGGLKRAL